MNDELYIKRALKLAKNGIGSTYPNPSVGAVIVYQNTIIGEGYTSPYGKNHAEVNAIESVKNKEFLQEATLYVTLEPCAHYGKTPPCANLIVKHRLKKVVIGCVDTNSLVAGKGIKCLKEAGLSVKIGVLEAACLAHHKRFFTFHNKKRPYIILKWAETQDGFIAPITRKKQKPVWISNPFSQQIVHKWRSQEHAILVGTNTVIEDNPTLNVRSWSGINPIRIILDRAAKIAKHANVLDKSVKTIIIGEKETNYPVVFDENLILEKIDFSSCVATQLCSVLFKHQIQSVLIEGGTQTLQTFINTNLWDEARIFIGATAFKKGIEAPCFSKQLFSEKKIITDTLKIYKND